MLLESRFAAQGQPGRSKTVDEDLSQVQAIEGHRAFCLFRKNRLGC